MAGSHNAEHENQGPAKATETTSISLPPQPPSSLVEPKLSTEDRAAVSSLPAGSALLIAHAGPNVGARFLLDQDITTAGRHPNAGIFLDDVTVSRHHVDFRRDGDDFVLADSRSLNGTYVNNDRVDKITLKTGYEVQIGKFRLTFYAARD